MFRFDVTFNLSPPSNPTFLSFSDLLRNCAAIIAIVTFFNTTGIPIIQDRLSPSPQTRPTVLLSPTPPFRNRRRSPRKRTPSCTSAPQARTEGQEAPSSSSSVDELPTPSSDSHPSTNLPTPSSQLSPAPLSNKRPAIQCTTGEPAYTTIRANLLPLSLVHPALTELRHDPTEAACSSQ